MFAYSVLERRIFVFDDFDYTVLKRGVNSEIDNLVNYLLSITDGSVPQYNKFVITSNRSIDDIDEAFLRPGRLFAIIELQKIDIDELHNYDKTLAEECKKVYKNKNKLSLAEINRVRLALNRKKKLNDFATKQNVVKTLINTKKIGFRTSDNL